jgi:hypothetical protein
MGKNVMRDGGVSPTVLWRYGVMKYIISCRRGPAALFYIGTAIFGIITMRDGGVSPTVLWCYGVVKNIISCRRGLVASHIYGNTETSRLFHVLDRAGVIIVSMIEWIIFSIQRDCLLDNISIAYPCIFPHNQRRRVLTG